MVLDISRFNEITSDFSSKSVLVIGDLMLDSYFWGQAERISPEAPVPIIHVKRSYYTPGGAGNVALNLAGLKSRVSVVGVIGNGSYGQILSDHLQRYGVAIDGIVIDPDRPTTVKTRIIAQNQQVVRFDQEIKAPIKNSVQKKLLYQIDDILPDCNGVILEDYNKGVFTAELIHSIINRAQQAGVPVYVDPKKDHFFEYQDVRLFKPNSVEFHQALGTIYDEEEFWNKGSDFRQQIDAEMLIVTRGKEGISLFTQDGHNSIPTKARQVHDVSGAGDTVISTFALADLCGATPIEAATLANYAAGRVCEEVGVFPIGMDLLHEIFRHHNIN